MNQQRVLKTIIQLSSSLKEAPAASGIVIGAFAGIVLAICLGGCAKSSESSPQTPTAHSEVVAAPACSQALAEEHRTALHGCADQDLAQAADGTLAACRARLQAFLEHHPDVHCQSGDQGMIDAQTLEGRLDAMSSPSPHDVRPASGPVVLQACSDTEMSDEQAVSTTCKGLRSRADIFHSTMSAADLRGCEAAVDEFLQKHPDINCLMSAAGGTSAGSQRLSADRLRAFSGALDQAIEMVSGDPGDGSGAADPHRH